MSLLFPIALLIIVFVRMWGVMKDSFLLFYKASGLKTLYLTQHSHNRIHTILLQNNYYCRLSEEGKKKFMTRTLNFMFDKEFGGMKGLEVTEEMKVLVSACAVQLTWGLKTYKLHHFHSIRLYPESFYSRLMQHQLKGGVTKTGVIFLSWKDFVEGYATPDDKYNLGLHEMAHALKLDVTQGEYFDEHFGEYLNSWLYKTLPEFEKIKEGRTTFLRDYAGTNLHEFFAVCVEHFFEAPEEFKQKLPDIYHHLCFILNQDPLNKNMDFTYTGSSANFNSPVATPAASVQKEETRLSNYYFFAVLSVIFGLVFYFTWLFSLRMETMITDTEVFAFIFLFGTMNFIRYKKFRELKIRIPFAFIIFSYVGIGIIGTCLFLALNRVSVNEESDEKDNYIISSLEWVDRFGKNKKTAKKDYILFSFTNSELESYPLLRTYPGKMFGHTKAGDTLCYTFGTGLFGIKTVTGVYRVKSNP